MSVGGNGEVTVILVDDGSSVLKMVSEKMDHCGISVIKVKNKELDKKFLKSNVSDGIIYRLSPAVKDQYEVINRIRDAKGNCFPILLIAGMVELDEERLKKDGVIYVLEEPIDFKKLGAILGCEEQVKAASKDFDFRDLYNEDNEDFIFINKEDFVSITLSSTFSLKGAPKKDLSPIEILQFLDKKISFETDSKVKIDKKKNYTFNIVCNDLKGNTKISFDAKISDVSEPEEGKIVIEVDHDWLKDAKFKKFRKIYEDRQNAISDFIKNAKGL